jgi:hypothetical protein
VSTWRKRALELFPDLRSEIEPHDATIYTVFFELLPRVQEAHDRGDTDELTKIYGFAEWCFRQKAKDLWNAAGVAFYEHLGDSNTTLRAMPKWVKPDIFAEIQPLLAARMKPAAFDELRKSYGARRMAPA